MFNATAKPGDAAWFIHAFKDYQPGDCVRVIKHMPVKTSLIVTVQRYDDPTAPSDGVKADFLTSIAPAAAAPPEGDGLDPEDTEGDDDVDGDVLNQFLVCTDLEEPLAGHFFSAYLLNVGKDDLSVLDMLAEGKALNRGYRWSLVDTAEMFRSFNEMFGVEVTAEVQATIDEAYTRKAPVKTSIPVYIPTVITADYPHGTPPGTPPLNRGPVADAPRLAPQPEPAKRGPGRPSAASTAQAAPAPAAKAPVAAPKAVQGALPGTGMGVLGAGPLNPTTHATVATRTGSTTINPATGKPEIEPQDRPGYDATKFQAIELCGHLMPVYAANPSCFDDVVALAKKMCLRAASTSRD